MKRVDNMLVNAVCLSVLLFALMSGAAAESRGRSVYAFANKTNTRTAQYLQLAQANSTFLNEVEKRALQLRSDKRFQQEIRDYPAGEKMRAFVSALTRQSRSVRAPNHALQLLKRHRHSAVQSAQTSSISGRVLVEGATTFESIEVLAFDEHGFFVASATPNFSGDYTLSGLDAGSYYLATNSAFVDEFYDNVLLDDFKNWRDATLVDVTDSGNTPGIDFDLLSGASLSGTIFEGDGTTPVEFRTVDFTLFDATTLRTSHEISVFTDGNGDYTIGISATGTFKLRADVSGLSPVFWNNKPDVDSADPIVIATFDDVVTGIDFSLPAGGESSSGKKITGTVTGPQDVPVILSFVFAFDLSDTTIAGIAVSSDSGRYEVDGLDPGSYVMYANNFTGFLLPPSVRGEYYQEAQTSADATPVVISAGTDSVTGINFTLDAGGAISGKITDNTGSGLDSVMVIAAKLDLGAIGKFPFDDIDFSVTLSDSLGNYVLGGLAGGDYVLRTVTLFGRGEGVVVDEYYMDVSSLFDFQDATPVTATAPDTTKGIDFELQLGGTISGHFFETDGTTPVTGKGSVVVFNADTGLPELVLSEFDSSDASYSAGPLPSGDFKLLAIMGLDLSGSNGGLNSESGTLMKTTVQDQVVYVPQFYDGKTTLADADPVAVTAPNAAGNIDFRMVRAGGIEGVISIGTGFPAGADSLDQTLVVAYDAVTGEVAGSSDLSFSGGYRIPGLPPGNYKIEALTAEQGYSATYYGGGASFGDANTTTLAVSSDAMAAANIDLDAGTGIISGTVTNMDGTALDGILVLAYDATGHVQSAGISGIDPETRRPLGTGEYFIPGLRAGDYSIRTFSFFQILLLLENANTGGLGNADPLSLIFGLLGSSGDLSSNLNIQLHGDVWYPATAIEINPGELDLFSLLFTLASSNGNPEALLPFFASIPPNADQVSVTSPGLTGGIDLTLPDLRSVLTAVETANESQTPDGIALAQNYPNPFNPSTVVSYTISRATNVSLGVYNLLGQRIRTLFEGVRPAGAYSTRWDGRNDQGQQVAGGVYFLRLKTENIGLSRKMLLLR